jgi:hypothetical protein
VNNGVLLAHNEVFSKMADNHELDRELSSGLDKGSVPCENCPRLHSILSYLEDGEGSEFTMSEARKRRLRELMSRAADDGVMEHLLYQEGLCPFSMLHDRYDRLTNSVTHGLALSEVKDKVPVGSCTLFDDEYRPGIQITQE